jgi:sugar lactone lactonase YvrE
MKLTWRTAFRIVVSLSVLSACGAPVEPPTTVPPGTETPDAGPADGGTENPNTDAGVPPTGLPILGNGTHQMNGVVLKQILGGEDGLYEPRDVAVNPALDGQLWVPNYGDSSMTILSNLDKPGQSVKKKAGYYNFHFMPKPSAMAFGRPNRMATVHEEDEKTQGENGTPADFMGPSLWPTDSNFEGGHASHLDMLHNSPNAMGIAWDRDNVYWVFDGYHKSITRYDFAQEHEPGGDDHSQGAIERYVEGEVSYVPDVSSHMEFDQSSKLLYIADTGNSRIAVLDTKIGVPGDSLSPNYDRCVQRRMEGGVIKTLVSEAAAGLQRPSGLALRDGILYVSDNATSKIFAFNLKGELVDWLDLSAEVRSGGLMGMDFDAQGRLYVVDARDNRLLQISVRPN